jgi:hypothetical protein
VFTVSCRFACLNGGACVGPDQCECPRNATGATCADPVCDPPCENGATCSSGNRCLCDQGTSGTRCEKRYVLIWIINLIFPFLIKELIFVIGLSCFDVAVEGKNLKPFKLVNNTCPSLLPNRCQRDAVHGRVFCSIWTKLKLFVIKFVGL